MRLLRRSPGGERKEGVVRCEGSAGLRSWRCGVEWWISADRFGSDFGDEGDPGLGVSDLPGGRLPLRERHPSHPTALRVHTMGIGRGDC